MFHNKPRTTAVHCGLGPFVWQLKAHWVSQYQKTGDQAELPC